MLRFVTTLLLIAVLVIVSAVASHAEDRSKKEFWINRYGEVRKDKVAERAKEVFSHVLAASDRRAGVLPSFHIINYDGVPWAQSLPDGSILLTKNGLNYCYKGRNAEDGDARLAFVIGHELSHQFNGDFWQYKFLMAADEKKEVALAFQNIKEIAKDPDTLLAKEIQADQYGIIYAILAGYDSDRVINGDKNFFADWEQRSSKSGGSDYIASLSKKRILAVSLRLKEVSDRIMLFKLGVISFRIGNLDDAIILFERFATYYPGREVYGNIGTIYLRLAYDKFLLSRTDESFPYRLSFGIDAHSRAETINIARGFTEERYRDYSRFLNSAIENLRRAAEFDPQYSVAQNSLGSAYIIGRKYYDAVSVLESALKSAPNDQHIQNNLAVAYILLGKELGSDSIISRAEDMLKGLNDMNSRINLSALLIRNNKEKLAEATLYDEKTSKDTVIENTPVSRYKPGMTVQGRNDVQVIEEITDAEKGSLVIAKGLKDGAIILTKNGRVQTVLYPSVPNMRVASGGRPEIYLSNRGRNGIIVNNNRKPDYFEF